MAKPDTAPKTNHLHHHQAPAWGTWEDLLLACAVKRHGLQAWDSVAVELQSRTSLPPPLTTPHNCELKYRDLSHRFSSLHAEPAAAADESAASAASAGDSGDKVDTIPWLEELRKLRVADLRQELQRYDDSIMSLQSKVKKLEEEKEEESQQEPDLQEESKENRSDNDDVAGGGQPPGKATTAANSAAGEEESDRENRSVNGSNSTEHDKTGPEAEPKVENEEDEPALPLSGSDKMDRVSNESRPEGVDSYNGSSEPNRDRTVDESEEPSESKENSSDVQSSASLTKKKKRRGKGRRRVDELSGAGRGGEAPEAEDASPAANLAGAKPQPLVDILKMIRAHENSSLFERRLAGQEKEKYQSIVRQHMDLETIHSRLQKGSYSTCLSSFYRDLLLLFSNALVYYPKSSPEFVAACELHRLVSTEIQKKTAQTRTNDTDPSIPKSDPERPDSLLLKHKSSAPIVVCRKRSAFSAKLPFQKSEEKKSVTPPETKPPVKPSTSSPSGGEDFIKVVTKEKSVTGARSLRRSNTNIKNSSAKKPEKEPVETPKSDSKKGGDATGSTKKRSAADFLKRIKKNSPAVESSKGAEPGDSKNSKGSGSNGGVSEQKKKQMGKGTAEKGENKATTKQKNTNKEESGSTTKRGVGRPPTNKEESGSPTKRGVGRPPKKVVGDSGAVGGKRGRDSAAAKEASPSAASTLATKRPRKRTRR